MKHFLPTIAVVLLLMIFLELEAIRSSCGNQVSTTAETSLVISTSNDYTGKEVIPSSIEPILVVEPVVANSYTSDIEFPVEGFYNDTDKSIYIQGYTFYSKEFVYIRKSSK